jgi:hypothetical protein
MSSGIRFCGWIWKMVRAVFWLPSSDPPSDKHGFSLISSASRYDSRSFPSTSFNNPTAANYVSGGDDERDYEENHVSSYSNHSDSHGQLFRSSAHFGLNRAGPSRPAHTSSRILRFDQIGIRGPSLQSCLLHRPGIEGRIPRHRGSGFSEHDGASAQCEWLSFGAEIWNPSRDCC